MRKQAWNRYILKRRSDEVFRTIERSKDAAAKRKRRDNEELQNKERVRNLSHMRITRQNAAIRLAEQARDSSRRRITRQDTAKRALERAKDNSQKKSKRLSLSAIQLAQVKDKLIRRKLRENPDKKFKERECRIRRIELIQEQPEKLAKLRKLDAEKKAKARSSAIFRKRERESKQKHRMQIQEETLQVKLQKFKSKAKEGPTCICVCCGSLWFRSSVLTMSLNKILDKHDQSFVDKIFNVSNSENWVCRTCHVYIQKGQVPRLALSNGLDFPEIPDVLKDLTTLEERLVALRLPFLQIRTLGVDRQCGMKGNVVHIPNDLDTSVACIPRREDQASIIPVILVRRLDHEKPYLFQMVRPVKIYEAAKYLLTTPIYKEEGATLSLDWLEKAVAESQELENSSFKCQDASQSELLKCDQMETMVIQYGSEALKIAPGQWKRPMSLLMDVVADEAAYPTLYGGQRRTIPSNVTVHELWKSKCRRYDRR